MTKLTKKQKSLQSSQVPGPVSIDEGVTVVKKCAICNFTESVDLVLKLGIDTRQSDQAVRGFVVLPHGSGKHVKIGVFARGESLSIAKDMKVEFVGDDSSILDVVSKGSLPVDVVLATPDIMPVLASKAGKFLGPKKLMPSPNFGTVTTDVGQAITELRKGKVSFRNDKDGNVHIKVGNVNFDVVHLKENVISVIEQISKKRPAKAKGVFIRSVSISSTMGPGVLIKLGSLGKF